MNEPNNVSGRIPLDRQIKNKAGALRRAQLRADELARALDVASKLTPLDRRWYRLPELQRQIAENRKAIQRHLADLAKLRELRASGVTHRCAISRRTSRYRGNATTRAAQPVGAAG